MILKYNKNLMYCNEYVEGPNKINYHSVMCNSIEIISNNLHYNEVTEEANLKWFYARQTSLLHLITHFSIIFIVLLLLDLNYW